VIVRWGIDELTGVLDEVGAERPYLFAKERYESPVAAIGRWTELPSDRIPEAASAVAASGADVLVALGGGSAIDTAKAVSAAVDLPLVSIPTTYSGAEWTTFYGVRDPGRRLRGGGAGARSTGIVYEPHLTLTLPRAETVGTALNALAHCAEALYVEARTPESDRDALEGARLIGEWLPRVVEAPGDIDARTGLLRGAAHAGAALGGSALALGHALAQALGGRYGLPHGALNALTLPPALRFNEPVAAEAIGRLASALGTADASAKVEELARLGGFERLRDLGVPQEAPVELAEAVAERPGARANPRPVTAADAEQLLRSIW
jgi:maleylacetate reductase